MPYCICPERVFGHLAQERTDASEDERWTVFRACAGVSGDDVPTEAGGHKHHQVQFPGYNSQSKLRDSVCMGVCLCANVNLCSV